MKSRGLVAAVAAVAFFAVAGPAYAAQTYNDPAGDSQDAPDVTTITVSNNAAGDLTFRIETPNVADLATDMYMFVVFDSDRNAATGDQDGADYFLLIDGADRSFGFYRWTGARFEYFQTSATVNYRNGADVVFNRSVIGGVAGGSFAFWVQAFRGTDDATRRSDDAPNTGDYLYTLATGGGGGHRLGSMAIVAKPNPPRAGRIFSLVVKWVDVVGENLHATPDSVSCRARIGTTTLRATGRCKWRIPAKARGKTLRVTITVVWEGARKIQTLRFTVF